MPARRLTPSKHVAQVAKEPKDRRDTWVRSVLLDDENANAWTYDGESLPWEFEYRNWRSTGPRITVPQPALCTVSFLGREYDVAAFRSAGDNFGISEGCTGHMMHILECGSTRFPVTDF